MKKFLLTLSLLFLLSATLFLFIDYEKKINIQKSFIKIYEFITFKEKKYINLEKKN